MIEVAGFIATICFSISAIPQAWKSFKEKNAYGISWGTIILWVLGEVFMLAYTLGKYGISDMYLLTNYSINTVVCSVILYYKVFPYDDRVH
jgi:uncharacterized protein with PQ loop repeat